MTPAAALLAELRSISAELERIFGAEFRAEVRDLVRSVERITRRLDAERP